MSNDHTKVDVTKTAEFQEMIAQKKELIDANKQLTESNTELEKEVRHLRSRLGVMRRLQDTMVNFAQDVAIDGSDVAADQNEKLQTLSNIIAGAQGELSEMNQTVASTERSLRQRDLILLAVTQLHDSFGELTLEQNSSLIEVLASAVRANDDGVMVKYFDKFSHARDNYMKQNVVMEETPIEVGEDKPDDLDEPKPTNKVEDKPTQARPITLKRKLPKEAVERRRANEEAAHAADSE